MDDLDTPELSSWMGRPPIKPQSNPQPTTTRDDEEEEADISSWMGRPLTQSKLITKIPLGGDEDEDENENDEVENVNDDTPEVDEMETAVEDTIEVDATSSLPSSDQDVEVASIHDNDNTAQVQQRRSTKSQSAFYVELPKLAEKEKERYEYLPGHFAARKIIKKFRGPRYLIKLASGEKTLCTTRELCDLDYGRELLAEYLTKNIHTPERRTRTKPQEDGMVDWANVDVSDSERRTRQKPQEEGMLDWANVDISDSEEPNSEKSKDDDDDNGRPASGDGEESPENQSEASDEIQRGARRSSRLKPLKKAKYLDEEVDELGDRPGAVSRSSRLRPQRHNLRQSDRQAKSRSKSIVDISSEEEAYKPSRRSERTRVKPRRQMQEKAEDDISSVSEVEKDQKVVGAKEVFYGLQEQDKFRKRHRQECDTCYYTGDSGSKGPLVFCQGCTSSYHKVCLGHRGGRDHLVTKVGEDLFVLQCRRCVGLSHAKDHSNPDQGLCAVCKIGGPLSRPLRKRLTSREEQVLREQNGGQDPITRTDTSLLNNPHNVMFRCATCARAWHMHHLPERQTAQSRPDDEDDETLDDHALAQRRFELYHRSWICKDCVENQTQIDGLVAWRPVDVEAYVPGTTVTMMQELDKEYLVKWRAQSYFRATWMPGTWIWGVVAGAMRLAFCKKVENQYPKMTTQDAIPEDYYRVDIVFDVRYTSVVRNTTKEIDLARVREVDSAFVKYKGLGYEDAIWEKPPSYTDTDRWSDFKIAYADYVKKLHVGVPPQSTLRRHLTAIREQDFETGLMKKVQPSSMNGGEMMAYQLEGLNWLLYQWYSGQNAILADEMGLGKTIQLISLFAALVQDHKCWPFLVVVPNSTCPNWRREIQKWAPNLRAVSYYGSSAARKLTHDYELFPKGIVKDSTVKTDPSTPGYGPKRTRSEVKDIRAHIVIASYESVTEEKTRTSLQRIPWQGLVVDEGQRLKNDKNIVYDALSKLRFPFKVLLTGTPLQNNARELFNLLQFLDRTKNAAELEAKYLVLTKDNVPELHELLRPFFLRRTKAQVLTFLPPMAQIIIPITMAPLQKKVYKSILAKNPELMRAIFSRSGPLNSKDKYNLNNVLMQLRKVLCHPFVYSQDIEERNADPKIANRNLIDASSKLRLLEIMLPKLRERGHRVLIFSQFLNNLDVVEDFLDGLGFRHRRLDGTINALEKQKRIDDFNAPDSPYFAFLLSTRAGGVGINLATADTVIILDPDFNPHQDIQALSRAHRIGQKDKVLVFQLMTRGSAEEKIMQIGKKKMALDHVLIERMDQEEDAGDNVESILRHGAGALFEEDASEDIIYDTAAVDELLDRSQMEDTKISDDKTAESQFSFARIWAKNRSGFDEDFQEETGQNTPNPGIWDKILQERERAHAEEMAKREEALGRGKRKRQTVDYGIDQDEAARKDNATGGTKRRRKLGDPDPDAGSDTDYNRQSTASEEEHADDIENESELEQPPQKPIVKARAFKRVNVPQGRAPFRHIDGFFDSIPDSGLPRDHHCTACDQFHPLGWCSLKLAGVEYCGLCGLAHFGSWGICPQIYSPTHVATMIQTLKQSTEPREIIEEAVRVLDKAQANIAYFERSRKYHEAKERKAAERARKAELDAEAAMGRNGVVGNGVVADFPPSLNVNGVNGMNGISKDVVTLVK